MESAVIVQHSFQVIFSAQIIIQTTDSGLLGNLTIC